MQTAICTKMSSADRCVVIWMQIKAWSSANRKIVICHKKNKTKMLSHAHSQKCGNLLSDKSVVNFHAVKRVAICFRDKIV